MRRERVSDGIRRGPGGNSPEPRQVRRAHAGRTHLVVARETITEQRRVEAPSPGHSVVPRASGEMASIRPRSRSPHSRSTLLATDSCLYIPARPVDLRGTASRSAALPMFPVKRRAATRPVGIAGAAAGPAWASGLEGRAGCPGARGRPLLPWNAGAPRKPAPCSQRTLRDESSDDVPALERSRQGGRSMTRT